MTRNAYYEHGEVGAAKALVLASHWAQLPLPTTNAWLISKRRMAMMGLEKLVKLALLRLPPAILRTVKDPHAMLLDIGQERRTTRQRGRSLVKSTLQCTDPGTTSIYVRRRGMSPNAFLFLPSFFPVAHRHHRAAASTVQSTQRHGVPAHRRMQLHLMVTLAQRNGRLLRGGCYTNREEKKSKGKEKRKEEEG